MKNKKPKKPVHTSIRKIWNISPITKVKDSEKRYRRRKMIDELNASFGLF